jgi:signal transduction histidine kinase
VKKALCAAPFAPRPESAMMEQGMLHSGSLIGLPKGRLRTKFLLSLLLVSASLTCATLLIVRHRVRLQVSEEIREAVQNSVFTFQKFQRQREDTLERSAALLASEPMLEALMTAPDDTARRGVREATIQDASSYLWRKIGSGLFVLADRSGKLMALHPSTSGLTRVEAQEFVRRSFSTGESRDWWFGSGHLFQVSIQPIYFGAPAQDTPLGIVAMGYEIDGRVAADVGRVASSQVVFRYGSTTAVSTLTPAQQAELSRQLERQPAGLAWGPLDIRLGAERFVATSVELAPGGASSVSLIVLKSYDQATAFLNNLNRWLLGLGLVAIVAGSALVFVISNTFTRPLADLVAGVHALEKGDFSYPLTARGNDEVSELTRSFDRMRRTLRTAQQELLHAERLATIGRMASTISHDLRHPLTAILAYAEFLAEVKLDEKRRSEFYREIRQAVDQMTDQLNTLLEFSKARVVYRPVYGDVKELIQHAIRTMQARPEYHNLSFTFLHEGAKEAWFDPNKLQRALHNLLLNACEAVPPESGRIEVRSGQTPQGLEIRVADNGRGIPPEIRPQIFQPFVTHGKDTGTGLGLAVVQKIVQEHGGEVTVEMTGPEGTMFRIALPSKIPFEKAASLL